MNPLLIGDMLTTALRVVQWHIAHRMDSVAHAILRELFSTAASAEEFDRILHAWQSLGPPLMKVPAREELRKLPDLALDLFSTGHRLQAVRVLGSALLLLPALSEDLQIAARRGYRQAEAPVRNAESHAAAQELSDLGSSLIAAGSPLGIPLVGDAIRIGGREVVSLSDLISRAANLETAHRVTLPAEDADAILSVADALAKADRSESGNRLIALVAGAGGSRYWLKAVAPYAAVLPAGQLELGRLIHEKGYTGEAINLLRDMRAGSNPKSAKPPGLGFRSFDGGADIQLESIAPKPFFYFRLEGDGASRDQVLWDADFDLLFNYGTVTDAIASLPAEKAEALATGTHELTLMIAPSGFTLRDNVAGRATRIENGVLADPPRFRLKSPAKGTLTDPSAAGITVHLFLNMAPFYTTFLGVKLVDKLTGTPASPQKVDMEITDLQNAKAEPRQAILFIAREADAWNVHWRIEGSMPASRKVTQVSAAMLDDAYEKEISPLIMKIAENQLWKGIRSDLRLAKSAPVVKEAEDCMGLAMSAGWKLYNTLVADPVFKEGLELLNALPDGAKITVITDDVVFPWELIYPVKYSALNPKKAGHSPTRFWGARFQIESLMHSGAVSEKQPAQRIQPHPYMVTMGFNDSIDEDWKPRGILPVDLQKQYGSSLAPHSSVAASWDEIVEIFTEPIDASMIYVFCHGAATKLEFDKSKTRISPDEVSDAEYPNWPIVFLNACEAGDVNPLTVTTFRKVFREKKAAGLIAPSFSVPTLFAAYFGTKIIEEYTKGVPIGSALLQQRMALLSDNNPLGLWYSLQCPLDVQANIQ
jgi:hypothetical protein